MPWDEDETLQVSDFGIKQTHRVLICSENEDKTPNYDRAHWLAVAFIKLIRFYMPGPGYERTERNYLWKLYENEVIPLLRELRWADEAKRLPRFAVVAHALLTKLYMDQSPDLLIRWHDFDEDLPPDLTGHA